MSLSAHYSGEISDVAPRLRARNHKCDRCNISPPIAVLRAEAVCGACIDRTVYSKARGALSRGPAAGARVLVSFSGGQAGRALLDIVLRAMHVGRKRRVCANAAALVLDSSDAVQALGSSADDTGGGRRDATAQATARRRVIVDAMRCGLSVVYAPLCGMFAPSMLLAVSPAPLWTSPALVSGTPDSTPRAPPPVGRPALDGDATVEAAADNAERAINALRACPEYEAAARAESAFFAGLRSTDARADALECLTRRAGAAAAAATDSPVLLVADTADEVARRTLCAMASGRGAGVALDAAPVDDRHARGVGGVSMSRRIVADAQLQVPACAWARDPTAHVDDQRDAVAIARNGCVSVRPFLELEAAEIAFYCRLRRLPLDCSSPGLSAPLQLVAIGGTGSTVSSVTELLIAGLQRGFANTVHNVVRTSRKLRHSVSADPADEPLASTTNSTERGSAVLESEPLRTPLTGTYLLCEFCFAVINPLSSRQAGERILCRGCCSLLAVGVPRINDLVVS